MKIISVFVLAACLCIMGSAVMAQVNPNDPQSLAHVQKMDWDKRSPEEQQALIKRGQDDLAKMTPQQKDAIKKAQEDAQQRYDNATPEQQAKMRANIKAGEAKNGPSPFAPNFGTGSQQ